MWSHISSLSGYPFTNTTRNMLNMFCIIAFIHVERNRVLRELPEYRVQDWRKLESDLSKEKRRGKGNVGLVLVFQRFSPFVLH